MATAVAGIVDAAVLARLDGSRISETAAIVVIG